MSDHDRPLVSVLTTAFNRERYIGQAIESILASTFTDFELIIVDDCSRDRTYELAHRYLSDPRVQLFRNERNLGDYPNRNRAASLARGRYLKYVDSDDMIYPHGLAVMVRDMEAHPEAGIAFGAKGSGEVPYPQLLPPAEAYRRHFFGPGLFGNAPLSTIIRTSVFRAAGGFSGLRFAGDSELWLKIAARYHVLLIVEGLTWWRAHDGQELQLGRDSLAYWKADPEVQLAALRSPCCPLTAAEQRLAAANVTRAQARQIWRACLLERQPRRAFRLLRTSGLSIGDLVGGLRRLPVIEYS